MAKITNYKNSKLATFLSFLGYIGIVFGIYSFFKDELGVSVGIISLVIGFAIKLLASYIGKKTSEKESKNNENL